MGHDATTDRNADRVLDDNALAGTLEAGFVADTATVPGRCADCGAVNVVGELRAYVRAPGAVMRCPVCEGVILRVVETAEATYDDAREWRTSASRGGDPRSGAGLQAT